jgi:DNA-binding NarL/FixJ family response regulator
MPRSVQDRSARANRNAVIEAIADGCTYQEAARQAGVQVSTVARYMQDPAFTAALHARRATIASSVSAALTSRSLDAVDLLTEAMNDPETADANRIRAATAILQHAQVWRDADIDARITELEEQARMGNLRAVR